MPKKVDVEEYWLTRDTRCGSPALWDGNHEPPQRDAHGRYYGAKGPMALGPKGIEPLIGKYMCGVRPGGIKKIRVTRSVEWD